MLLGENDCAVSYKVLVLGDHSVGKTALLNSLIGKDFCETLPPTIGVDFVKKICEVDGALVQLNIWDSAGQERFRSITKQQYNGIQGIVLVYDVTCEMSFNMLKYWINSLQQDVVRAKGDYEPIPLIICGNKCDLLPKKKVSTSRGQELADKEMAFGFYETSAKTGMNVEEVFQTLAFHITDIHNPKLMKAYHPHLMRPESTADVNQPLPLRQFNGKRKAREKSSTLKENNLDQDGNYWAAKYKLSDTENSPPKPAPSCFPFFSVYKSGQNQITNEKSVEELSKKNNEYSSLTSCWTCFGRRRKDLIK